MSERIANFSAGPAALPLPVLERVQAELLNYSGSGMSVMEMSHRSKPFDEIIETAIQRVKRLLSLGDEHKVLFIQGGASMQFAMIPMNLAGDGQPVFINTGTWSAKAIAEAARLGFEPLVAASSEDRNYCYIPDSYQIPENAPYLHFVSNNTIKGTQWREFPQAPEGVPLVCDMSSDILSRPFDASPFGLIFAGAQKNLGPSGVCLVIIREDMLKCCPDNIPTMFDYSVYAAKNSLYNTPPTFAIYMVGKVLEWLEEDIGGLAAITDHNQTKAAKLYDCLDSSGGFYKATADKEARSLMNVTFRLQSEDLEAKFVAEALAAGFSGLKGHRSVGGCRASIYNATTQDQIDGLVAFMKDFAQANG